MSSFVLKLIAIICMFCDHFSDAVIGHLSVLNVIGRIAFPIFAFQLVIGFINTKNIKKYATRLLIFALIAQLPFMGLMFIMNYDTSALTFETVISNLPSILSNESILTLNIFFTLMLGLLTLLVYNNFSNKYVKWLSIILIIALAELAKVDYGGWGVFLILFIYLFYPKLTHSNVLVKNSPLKYFIFIFGYLLLCIYRYSNFFGVLSIEWVVSLISFSFLPIIFMLLYNNKKGPSMKYFFYIFYPLHLAILCFINLVLL